MDHINTYEKIATHIKSLGKLRFDWDGYLAEEVPPTIIEKALALLESCGVENLHNLDIFPNPNGTITFNWCYPGNLSINIEIGLTQYSIIEYGLLATTKLAELRPIERLLDEVVYINQVRKNAIARSSC